MMESNSESVVRRHAVLEYVQWRGDLPFSASPINEIDAMIFSQLCYLHFRDAFGDGKMPLYKAAPLFDRLPMEPGNAQVVAERHRLLHAISKTARFGGLLVGHCADRFEPELNMQFAASTFILPDESTLIAFRGTDATVVGWREDFAMSFSCPVPSQAEALDYLHAIAREATGSLRLCGHSKGGNLALYAAVCCAPEIRDRIRSIDLFDAPGLDDATFSTDGYQEALPKVRSYVPQGSVIGQLMNVPQPFTVVHSRALGIAQHNVFTWQLDGPRFATLPTLDKPSRLTKATMDEFLRTSTPETRRIFIDTLFSALGAGNALTLSDIAGHWTDTAGALLAALRTLDPSTRKAVLSMFGTMATSGVESARRLLGSLKDAPN